MPANFELEYKLQAKCRTITMSIESILHKMSRQTMQRLSEVQRDPTTWDKSWFASYIKSLFEGMSTTPFLLLHDSIKTTWSIHDGGHRDHVIQEFMKGSFGVRLQKDTNDMFWYYDNPSVKKFANHNNMQLSDAYKEKFIMTDVTVVTYTDLNEVEKAELFRRVNTALDPSPGEHINAIVNSPLNELVKALAREHELKQCLPLGGEKKKKRCHLLEKIAVVALNFYSFKSDGLERTEGGDSFPPVYEKLMTKEAENPEQYPPDRFKQNFDDTVNVLDSVDLARARMRDMQAVSNILNKTPVTGVHITTSVLSQFLKDTTSPATPETPWVDMWNGSESKNNSGCIKNIRDMREAFKMWHTARTAAASSVL